MKSMAVFLPCSKYGVCYSLDNGCCENTGEIYTCSIFVGAMRRSKNKGLHQPTTRLENIRVDAEAKQFLFQLDCKGIRRRELSEVKQPSKLGRSKG